MKIETHFKGWAKPGIIPPGPDTRLAVEPHETLAGFISIGAIAKGIHGKKTLRDSESAQGSYTLKMPLEFSR